MKRILHFVHALTRGGGLSNFVMNYYRNIDRSKVQFDFVYFREVESDFKDEITALGGRYFKFTEPSIGFAYKKEAEAFFKEHKNEYAAMHCHVLFAAAVYSDIAKKYGIKNIIVHSHNVGYGVGIIRQIRNYYFVKKAALCATHKLACSENAATFMFGKKSVKNGEVTVISNAIDCRKYIFDEEIRKNVREKLGVENKLVLGHVGGFAKQKNHIFLIDVFNEVHKKIPDSVLLLIGADGIASGSTKGEIVEKVKALGLEESVMFLGVRKDVNHLMMAMDVFVFPSIFEGFGLVLVEAQSSGLPCFASENVPRTAKCTGIVKFLPLDNGAEKWAEDILKLNLNNVREKDISLFEMYNIECQRVILENIYLDL